MNEGQIWWKHGVIYQIYPRSFQDSNEDGVGDLQGIISRLDYLVDLGIDAIWISPIYPSPMADFGYDVSDYKDIHPLFGDLETFDRLLDAAHGRKIRVILDYVPNHTSDEHPWFVESRASRYNPKRNWYIWREPGSMGSPPNNWESFFGGSAWEWDERTGQYYLHQFHRKQPDLNWRNPEVVKAMHDVLRFWMDRGVDGFRMDVVHHIIKHPAMPDNPMAPRADVQSPGETLEPIQVHKYDVAQPEVHQYLQAFRRIFDSYDGDRVTIGETWFTDPHELVTYYGTQLDELHMPFNFSLILQAWNAEMMKRVIEGYYRALPEGAWPNFVLGNHDTHRLASRYGEENHRSAGLLLLTLWGTPTLYYGDEIGMRDGIIPRDRLQDPVGVRFPDSERGRDPERTPMQWDDSPHAGFCLPEVEPWLPVADNFRDVNVAVEGGDPLSTLNYYRRLLALRREHPALHQGGIAFVDAVPHDVMAYLRTFKENRFLVLINFQNEDHQINLSALGDQAETTLSTHYGASDVVRLASVTLRPHEGLLLRLA